MVIPTANLHLNLKQYIINIFRIFLIIVCRVCLYSADLSLELEVKTYIVFLVSTAFKYTIAILLCTGERRSCAMSKKYILYSLGWFENLKKLPYVLLNNILLK